MSTWASYLATGPGPKKRFLVGGNWKCNGSVKQVGDLVSMLNAGGPIPLDVEVVVAPVSCHLSQAIAGLRSEVQVSAQNCADTAKCGAFTGEIAAPILTDLGCTWTITGHSERRTLYGETSELVASKTAIALGAGLSVMVCIGETLAERDGGKMFEVLGGQLSPLLGKLTENDWAKVAVAYEPVWAIGTGKVASPAMAQEVHAWLRQWIADNVSAAVAADTRIMYGGSVKGASAAALASEKDIDGFLVGGASLKPDFLTIINAASGHIQ